MQERKTAQPASKPEAQQQTSAGPDTSETRRREYRELLEQLEAQSGPGKGDPEWSKFKAFLHEQSNKDELNDSGQGSASRLPDELRGLNWGACLMNVIWGVAMKVSGEMLFLWMVLMLIIPIFPLYLLFKGNEIAWQSKKWESSEEFLEAQKKWSKIGWIVLVAVVVLTVAMGAWIMHMLGPLFKGTQFDLYNVRGSI
jgi:hypothetical protein